MRGACRRDGRRKKHGWGSYYGQTHGARPLLERRFCNPPCPATRVARHKQTANLLCKGHQGVALRANNDHRAQVHRETAQILSAHAAADLGLRLQDDYACEELPGLYRHELLPLGALGALR